MNSVHLHALEMGQVTNKLWQTAQDPLPAQARQSRVAGSITVASLGSIILNYFQ